MKLRKLFFATTPILLTLGTISTTITSCGNSYLPSIDKVEVRHAPIYHIYTDAEGKMYYAPTYPSGFDVYHFNGSEIGYVDVDSYVLAMMQFEDVYGSSMVNFNSSTKDNQTIINNPYTKSTCTINYNNQTITFSDYDAFLVNQTKTPNPLATGVNGGEQYFYSVENTYTTGKQYVIDLKKYNIKAYYYNNRGFLPYDLYRNILNVMPIENLFYNGKGFYQIKNAIDQATCDLYQSIRNTATVFTTEYMEYTYNLLALTLDNKFGMVSRPSRVNPGTTIKYFENGAYEALKPYHDRMVSTDDDISNKAWAEFFAACADDGGHAVYGGGSTGGYNVFTTQPIDINVSRGPETQNVYATKDRLTVARKAAGYDMESFWGSGTDRRCYYKEYDVTGSDKKVAYVTFDSFRGDKYENYNEKEQKANRELASETNDTNYWQDTLRMTMYANKMIKQNNIKNVVIDISINGGGVVYSESFIASWLCNGVTQKLYNPHTNAYTEYVAKADIDGDGQFTANDYIGDDVNVYMIISGESFSCGNALPCNVADGRPSTIFIGEQTAGGACYTDTNLATGLGNVYRGSSNYHWLRKASTYDNHISFDAGALPSDTWAYDSKTETSKYYDRKTINKRILGLI